MDNTTSNNQSEVTTAVTPYWSVVNKPFTQEDIERRRADLRDEARNLCESSGLLQACRSHILDYLVEEFKGDLSFKYRNGCKMNRSQIRRVQKFLFDELKNIFSEVIEIRKVEIEQYTSYDVISIGFSTS